MTETRDMFTELNERVNWLSEAYSLGKPTEPPRSSSKLIKIDGQILSSNHTDLTDPLTPNFDDIDNNNYPRTSIGSNPFSNPIEPSPAPFFHSNINQTTLYNHRKRDFPHQINKIATPKRSGSNFFKQKSERPRQVKALTIKRSVSEQNINLQQAQSANNPNFIQNWVENARRATLNSPQASPKKTRSENNDKQYHKRIRSSSLDTSKHVYKEDLLTRFQSDETHAIRKRGPPRRIRLCSENTTRYNYSRKNSIASPIGNLPILASEDDKDSKTVLNESDIL